MSNKHIKTIKDGFWAGNPIFVQTLGICSALAVTTKVQNALVMGLALTGVTGLSNVAISLMRNVIPHRIRLIVEMIVIAALVILFDQLLKAYYFEMSEQLSVYVGLIITNCIVLGRAEAYALQNGPFSSFLDGIGNGLGYAAVLVIVAAFRELLGSGGLWNHRIMPASYEPIQLMVLAPGAFIMLGLLYWVFRGLNPVKEEK